MSKQSLIRLCGWSSFFWLLLGLASFWAGPSPLRPSLEVLASSQAERALSLAEGSTQYQAEHPLILGQDYFAELGEIETKFKEAEPQDEKAQGSKSPLSPWLAYYRYHCAACCYPALPWLAARVAHYETLVWNRTRVRLFLSQHKLKLAAETAV